MTNLIISNICNANCDFCFASSFLDERVNHSKQKFMSFDEIRSYVHLFDQADIHDIRLLGGEPTLHPAFDEIIAFAKANSKHITIFTNGCLSEIALAALENLSPDECAIIMNMNAKISQEQIRTREKTLIRLGDKVISGYTITQPVFSLDSLIQTILDYNLQRIVRLGLSLPIFSKKNKALHPKQFPVAGHCLAQQSFTAFQYGIQIEPDCGFVRCMFSEDDFQILKKHDFHYVSCCSPVIDICSEGHFLHCFALSEKFYEKYHESMGIHEIRENLIERTNPWRISGIYPECGTCLYKRSGECCGGCLSMILNRFHPIGNSGN